MGRLSDKNWYLGECKKCKADNCDFCNAQIKAFEKLEKYEDLEEQGKLLKLPCAVGDTVYRIQICQAPSCQVCRAFNRVDNCLTRYRARIFKTNFTTDHISGFGKTIFLTKEEAKDALENLRFGGKQ